MGMLETSIYCNVTLLKLGGLGCSIFPTTESSFLHFLI